MGIVAVTTDHWDRRGRWQPVHQICPRASCGKHSLAGALPWPSPEMPSRAAVVPMGSAATATSASSTKPDLPDAGPLMEKGYHPHCTYC